MLSTLRWRSAVKHYARRLGPQLLRDYGYSTHYTPAQIRSSAARAKLAARYIDIGYAAFLPKKTFMQVAETANLGAYEDINRLFAAFKPVKQAAWGDNPESSNVS